MGDDQDSRGLWAVVPVKGLSEAKGRLMPYLNDQDRVKLVERMLERVFAALSDTMVLDGWLVISRDEEAFDRARRWGGQCLWEEGQGLNNALTQAARWLASLRAKALLVLPGDLPLIRSKDIEKMVAMAQGDRCLVIAPSQRDGGTNGLLLRPPQLIPFRFGHRSFQAHLSEAQRRSVPVHICDSPSLALDIDTVEDLSLWQQASTTG